MIGGAAHLLIVGRLDKSRNSEAAYLVFAAYLDLTAGRGRSAGVDSALYIYDTVAFDIHPDSVISRRELTGRGYHYSVSYKVGDKLGFYLDICINSLIICKKRGIAGASVHRLEPWVLEPVLIFFESRRGGPVITGLAYCTLGLSVFYKISVKITVKLCHRLKRRKIAVCPVDFLIHTVDSLTLDAEALYTALIIAGRVEGDIAALILVAETYGPRVLLIAVPPELHGSVLDLYVEPV